MSISQYPDKSVVDGFSINTNHVAKTFVPRVYLAALLTAVMTATATDVTVAWSVCPSVWRLCLSHLCAVLSLSCCSERDAVGRDIRAAPNNIVLHSVPHWKRGFRGRMLGAHAPGQNFIASCWVPQVYRLVPNYFGHCFTL